MSNGTDNPTVDPKKPHRMVVSALYGQIVTSATERQQYQCLVCGRVTDAPTVWCYTLDMFMRGEPNPVVGGPQP